MGGFHVFDGDTPLYPLDWSTVKKLIETGALIPPTEDEINDRSKGDELSKTIVLVQTLWFVLQCLARGVQGLPITELEIVTLTYTTVIIGIYAFWWSKPLNVIQPIRLPRVVVDPSAVGPAEPIQSTRGWGDKFEEGFTGMSQTLKWFDTL